MYLANVAGGISFTDVARGFGRNRSTVAHACGLIEDLRDDPNLDRSMTLLEGALRSTFRLPDLQPPDLQQPDLKSPRLAPIPRRLNRTPP